MTEKFKNKEKARTLKILLGLLLFNLVIIIITLVTHYVINKDFLKALNYLFDQVYLKNFFRQPALVLGFITLFGYLIMGRGMKDSTLGALKCVIGYILLAIGSGTLTGVAGPVFQSIKSIGGSDVVPLDPYFALNAGTQFFEHFKLGANFVTLITYVFVVAFVINIILVALKKWTNVNSLMITGHVMLQQAAVITPAFYILLFGQIPLLDGLNISGGSQAGVVIIAGIFLGVYWGVASTGTLRATNKVTGDAGFAIGHQQMITISIAYKLSRFFGSPENSAETKKMPKALKIFEDNIFVQTLIITLLFVVLFIILLATKTIKIDGVNFDGLVAAQWNSVFGGAHWVLNIFGGSLKLVAALICMMTGVRMFVTELQQSFTGLSEKLVKDAVIAVDIAAVYGFAPNSVTFAFASGTIAQFFGTFCTIGLSLIPGSSISIVIPLFVTLFFNSGAIGPYANAAGGMRAVLIVPAIIGFLEVIIISLGLWALSYSADNSELGYSITRFEKLTVEDSIKQSLNWTSTSPTRTEFETLMKTNNIDVTNLVDFNEKTFTVKSEIVKQLNTIKLGDKTLNNILKVDKVWDVNPFAQGYIGMGDWTMWFGLLMLLSGWSWILASIFIPIFFIAIIIYGQILDSGKQHKKTWLQKLLKLNPELIPVE